MTTSGAPTGAENRRPLVSVCITTYNHRAFIGQALDSVLVQETSFPFEVCIGEDESDDGTRDICLGYARRHPDVVRLFLRRRCDVIVIHGRPSGRFNFTETFRACRGRYIALLEGDDFWISKDKLQRQVDVLEGDPTIAVCGHDVECVDASGAAYDGPCVPPPGKPVSSTADLLERNYLATASMMLRNGAVEDFPPWFFGLRMADWPLAVLVSKAGNIAFLPEKMAAYRKHAAGIWSVMDGIERHSGEAEFYRAVQGALDGRLKRLAFEKEQRSVAYVANLEGRYHRARWHRLLAAAARGPAGIVNLLRDRLAWRRSGTDGG